MMEMIHRASLAHEQRVGSQVVNAMAASTLEEKPVYELAGYYLKVATTWQEIKAAHQLRAKVYDTELQWSHANNGMEADVFDQYACHYVVIAPTGEVAATLRVLGWRDPWMAAECYDGRFVEEAILFQTPNTQEVSRLCIAQSHRDKKIAGRCSILDLVLEGLLAVGRRNHIRYSYFVTRAAMERVLMKRSFVVHHTSSVHKMPDGCRIKSFLVDNYDSHQRVKLQSSTPRSIDRYSFTLSPC